MKFSIFSVMAPSYGVDELPGVLNQYGYDGIEWRVSDPAPSTPPDPLPPQAQLFWQYNRATLNVHDIIAEARRAKAACDAHGLECVSLASYLPTGDFDAIETLMSAAREIGAPMIRLFPARYDPSLDYVELFNGARRDLLTVEELAKRYSVCAVLEQHMGTIIPSASAAYRLVEGRDPEHIGIVFDAGNMVHEGFEQYMLGMQLLGRYVRHVHIKDAKMIDGAAVWSPIGNGDVRFELIFDALKHIGYDGYLSFEDFSVEHSDGEKLKRNIEYIRWFWG